MQLLVQKLGEQPEPRGDIDARPAYQVDWAEAKRSQAYHYKTGCVDDPAVLTDLQKRGLFYNSLEMGATRWLVLVPADAYENRKFQFQSELPEGDRKLALLLVFHKESYDDPFWAMKTLELFKEYVNAAAERRNCAIIFIVSNDKPEPAPRPMFGPRLPHMFGGIITEGLQNYRGDKDRIYVDLSLLRAQGIQLKQIEGFQYKDENGTAVSDPDSKIEMFNGVPVLNFSKRWVVPWRPQPVDGAGDGTVNADWLMRSEVGRKLLDSRRFQQKYSSPDDPEVRAYWQRMGLRCSVGYVADARWVLFAPLQSHLKKLPVVICLSEVNEPDDHSIIRAFSTFRYFCETAAQGDCAVIFFAMESPELNDWLIDILQDAARQYPPNFRRKGRGENGASLRPCSSGSFELDLSRVYITGHSHNGHFAQEFARRHPNVIACVVPLGNTPGLPEPAVSHEAVAVDGARAALMETMDMPTCIICGCKEVGCMVPVNKAGHAFEAGINVEGLAASAENKIAMWNRRLKAERCPRQALEDVLAAAGSETQAERELGFPCDRAETIYIGGFEHYIADLKNIDGKYHFRVIAVENMPHTVEPTMLSCAWNYMRKFARDQETGKVIEL
jgi:hypothetical protein